MTYSKAYIPLYRTYPNHNICKKVRKTIRTEDTILKLTTLFMSLSHTILLESNYLQFKRKKNKKYAGIQNDFFSRSVTCYVHINFTLSNKSFSLFNMISLHFADFFY